MTGAVTRAVDVADIIELRLDCLAPEEPKLHKWEIQDLLETRRRPIILTLRPSGNGGSGPVAPSDRLVFRLDRPWGPTWGCYEYWDVELDLVRFVTQRKMEGKESGDLCDWKRTICSHHDFAGVPNDLDGVYEAMAATPATLLKIVVQADDAVDCLAIFNLLERAQRDDRELIAFAMGAAGVMTRILGPSRGSFLTFGSLDDDSATAPGQLTARELREVYRLDEINQHTEVLGLIGKPVRHSISPNIHNAVFAQGNINAVFMPIEVGDLDSFMRRMVRESSREIEWNLRGLSVTAPHKTAVMRHLDWIDPAAREIGAVNTLVVREGELSGCNTDAAGFITPLKARMGSLERVRCAVIGAGGAARAVVWALRQEQANTTVFARNPETAAQLKDDFGVEWRPLDGASFSEFDVVIHATPIGTRGKTETETLVGADQLRGVRLAYDLVYNPLETQFMREAGRVGCETIGGLEMLIGQAVEQLKLWTGKDPDVETMRRAAVNALK